MIGSKPTDSAFHDGLADYRATVERLRGETAEEFGGQPMPPEKLSMIATAIVSLPLVALLLPTCPLEPQVWHLAGAQALVWCAAFRIQSPRYHRFMSAWRGKVAACEFAMVPAERSLRFRR